MRDRGQRREGIKRPPLEHVFGLFCKKCSRAECCG